MAKLTKKNIFTIPNMISVFRFVLIPFILYFYIVKKEYVVSVVLIGVSCLSDIVDGAIARTFNLISDLGKLLDPVADKLTQGALMICLISRYKWMIWMTILLGVKELLMFIFGLISYKKTDKVNGSKWYGKVSTVVTMASILALIIFTGMPEKLAIAIAGVASVVMVTSLVLYGLFYKKFINEEKINK